MAMRPYIRFAQKNIQKPVRIIGRTGMKIMIHSKPGRRRSQRCNGIEQGVRDQLYFTHF
jgi:hypothetical protein